MKNYQSLQKQYIVSTYVDRQLTLVRGSGVFLFDEYGRQYLDFMSNYGVTIFGYNHPKITSALSHQLKNLPTLHGSFNSDVRTRASEQLVMRCGLKYAQVYWSNSGAEAIDAALKFAVLATKKKRFIVCDHGYHGKTLGALSATSGEKYRKPFEPLLWEFVQIPFNDTKALEDAIDANTAGFIVEPIQGEGGVHVPCPNYLQAVRDICDQKNILLIIDEIQTGVGRTGEFLASHKENVSGDIVCLGKGLAGGIPVGATVMQKKIADAVPKHMHTSTFGGNPLACAGVIATLKLLDHDQLDHIKNMGIYFREQLSSMCADRRIAVRGNGLMIGLSVQEKRNHILKALQDHYILAIPSGEDVVRFLSPFIIQKEHIDIAIKALQKILNNLSCHVPSSPRTI